MTKVNVDIGARATRQDLACMVAMVGIELGTTVLIKVCQKPYRIYGHMVSGHSEEWDMLQLRHYSAQ